MRKGIRQRAGGASNVTHLLEGRFKLPRAAAAAQLAGRGAGRSAKLLSAQLPAALRSALAAIRRPRREGGPARFRKRNGEESTSWKSQVGNPGLLEGPELPVQPLQLLLQMLLLICKGGF